MSSFFASFLTFHGKNFLLQIGDAPVLCGVLGSPGGCSVGEGSRTITRYIVSWGRTAPLYVRHIG